VTKRKVKQKKAVPKKKDGGPSRLECTAYHEAGHAVMAYCWGRTFSEITIERDLVPAHEIPEDISVPTKLIQRKGAEPEVVDNLVALGGVRLVPAGRSIPKRLWPEETQTTVDILLAGPVAEAIRRGRTRCSKGQLDVHEVAKLLPKCTPRDLLSDKICVLGLCGQSLGGASGFLDAADARDEKYFEFVEARIRANLVGVWPVVEALAHDLLDRMTVNEHEALSEITRGIPLELVDTPDRVAYHEAGHAVVAWSMGVGFGDLRFVPGLPARQWPQRLKWDLTRIGLVECTICLGGPAADGKLTGRCNWPGSGSDWSAAAQALDEIAGSAKEEGELLMEGLAEAQKLIRQLWPAVCALAKRLPRHRKKALRERSARRIIENALR